MPALKPSVKSDAIVSEIRNCLESKFPLSAQIGNEVAVERYSRFSIKVTVVSDRYEGKSEAERELITMKALKPIGKDAMSEIATLLMITPDEVENEW